MKSPIFLLLAIIITIAAVILDVYLIVDVVKSIINDTKTTLQLTFEILIILVVVPLCSQILILLVFWILNQFR